MNRKAISLAAILIGALLVTLGFYQVNQYIVTSATANAAMKQMSSLGAEASAELAAGMSEAMNVLLQTMAVDFVAGVILLAAGISSYPSEKK